MIRPQHAIDSEKLPFNGESTYHGAFINKVSLTILSRSGYSICWLHIRGGTTLPYSILLRITL